MKESLLAVLPLISVTQQALEERYHIHKLWQADDQESLLRSIAGEVRGVVTDGHAGASAKLLQQLPKVEVVSVFGVGVDAVDVDYCKANGIRVGNTPEVLNDDVADLALALTLAAYRRLPEADSYVRNGRWPIDGNMPLTNKLSGSRVGIFGMGRIGLAIARRFEGFDCSISYCNRNPRDDVDYRYYTDLVEMAGDVDCLIVSVAPNPSMRGIIGSDVIAAIGSSGYLINVSRGFLVDEPALISALQQGQIAGAGLDVFDVEPQVPPELFEMPNVVLQPHAASGTIQTRTAMGQLVLDNLENHFAGEELAAFVA